ncbi:hypothetical protein HQ535_03700 [bacterium]|nr:hypothetical protein [bacterium]
MRRLVDGAVDAAVPVVDEILRLSETADVVVSSEGFWRLMAPPLDAFTEILNRLVADRSVVLALYVRPQHEYLEASWRQWGFRTRATPSRYISRQSERAYYQRWIREVGLAVPGLEIVARPVVAGALVGGQVVEDFASSVLAVDVDIDQTGKTRHNAGLPLHAVNLLRMAPKGKYFRGPHDNKVFQRIQEIAFEWPEPDIGSIEESRRVLQRWCIDTYEAGNRILAAEHRWGVVGLIPAMDEAKPPELDRLDDLWSPPEDVDLDVIWSRLDAALAAHGA